MDLNNYEGQPVIFTCRDHDGCYWASVNECDYLFVGRKKPALTMMLFYQLCSMGTPASMHFWPNGAMGCTAEFLEEHFDAYLFDFAPVTL